MDPSLLLACVYYDQNHCGYLQDRDLEDIIFSLGLDLSRAQVSVCIVHRPFRGLFKLLSLFGIEQASVAKRNSYQQLQSDLGKDPFMVESLCMTTVGRTARIPPQRINIGVGFYILGA